MGFESLRNIGYRHASEDGTAMPFDPALIGKYLKDRKLDGNLYDQILLRGLYDEDKTTQEQLHQWEERRGKFYLGDGKSGGKWQFWCPEWGAIELSTGYRIYIDVSYKSTPRIARLKKPYGGVLHILAGRKNDSNEWVPHTTPCATILLEKPHPSGQEFLDALNMLRHLCVKEYNIDIINDTERTELFSMGDIWKKVYVRLFRFYGDIQRKKFVLSILRKL